MTHVRTTPAAQPRRLRLLLVALIAVTLLTAMDQTIVATALPAIVAGVGGSSLIGWVFAGYTLAITITLPVAGRLGDLVGRRRAGMVIARV